MSISAPKQTADKFGSFWVVDVKLADGRTVRVSAASRSKAREQAKRFREGLDQHMLG